MKKAVLLLAVQFVVFGFLGISLAEAKPSKDLLVKLKNPEAVTQFAAMAQDGGAKVETLGTSQWLRIRLSDQQLQSFNLEQIRENPNVLYAQPNYRLSLPSKYRVEDPAVRDRLSEIAPDASTFVSLRPDNPDIPAKTKILKGNDPLMKNQWGMSDIEIESGWKKAKGMKSVVVAVIDTGVDYTHEDLVNNMWRNPGEIPNNKIDDDHNGFVDDVVGWDFVSNDNKPFDYAMNAWELILFGGNPGHGTHCAGNIAATAKNKVGIAGVAPNAQIMAIRFLSEKGGGTTSDAVKAIDYAVKNGAKILSNSWGSEGEDPNEPKENLALREAVSAAQNAGVLFIAAAGNGHEGVGYDNDTDARPAVPASYSNDNIISVAALDSENGLGSFSNWGAKTVDIGAPGVKVFSTTADGKYNDVVVEMNGIKVFWDGTSMATPHVAGAAALYWGKYPNASWVQVKNAILSTATPVSAMAGKSVSGGKLNVKALMQMKAR